MNAYRKHDSTFIVPADQRDAANAAIERHGYGPDNFSIPLRLGTSREITHYGCSMTFTEAELMSFRLALTSEGTETQKKLDDALMERNMVRHKEEETRTR